MPPRTDNEQVGLPAVAHQDVGWVAIEDDGSTGNTGASLFVGDQLLSQLRRCSVAGATNSAGR